MKRLAYLAAVCVSLCGCLGSGESGTSGSTGGACAIGRCVNQSDCTGTDVCIDGCCAPPFGNASASSGSGSGSGSSGASSGGAGSGTTG